MKFCRIQALIEELLIDWDKLNLAAKLLVYIALFLIIATIFIAFCETDNKDIYSRIEVTFRTSLASVFGFLLSSNTKSKCKDSNKNNYTITVDKEKAITEECKMKKEYMKYYYGEGNTVQIVIALGVTLICAMVILMIYISGPIKDLSILAQFRDLMCSSIGFLLGEAKIKPRD